MSERTRRDVFRYLAGGTAGSVLLAGCTGEDDGDGNQRTGPADGTKEIEASLAVAPNSPEAREEVTLDGSASSTDNGEIDRYEWRVGDDRQETDSPVTTHVFDQAGTHNIGLTVIDDEGLEDSAEQTVDVQEFSGKTFTDIYVETLEGHEELEEQLRDRVDLNELADRMYPEVATISERMERIFSYAAEEVDRDQGTLATKLVAHNLLKGQNRIEPVEEAIIDERIGISGGPIPITAVYANDGSQDEPEWHKSLGVPWANATGDDGEDYLRHGEEPETLTENDIEQMWDETNSAQGSALEFRDLDQTSEDWDDSSWEAFNDVNDGILVTVTERDGEIGYTKGGGLLISELEDISSESHNQAVEYLMRINEFYENNVPEDEYMIIHSEDGELDIHTVGEEDYRDAVLGLNYEP